MGGCFVCPRNCGADRKNEIGICGAGNRIRIARAAIHRWEEPCISGSGGSGTVFFSGCALKCVFCQNRVISHENKGIIISENRLYEIMFELKEKGAHNINLVTADHYIPQILPVLKKAKDDGLEIPIILNSSSYLKESVIKAMSGIVDIYLADFKFYNSDIADKYCSAPDYPKIAKHAIKIMVEQIGKPVFENGIMKRGVIVRVLVLPDNIIDAKMTIKYLNETYSDNIFISIMNQYTPVKSEKYKELCRSITEREYKSVVDFAINHGVKNAYIQDFGTCTDAYIPEFDFEGVL